MTDQMISEEQAGKAWRGRMPWPLRILGVFACAIVLFLTIGQIADIFRQEGKPLNTLDPKGSIATDIQDLVKPVFYIALLVFVLVLGGVLVIVWKYRERPGDDEEEFVKQTEGNTTFEIAWTLAPALLLAVVGVLTVGTLQKLQPDQAKPNVLKVKVIGQQWWWAFKYDLGDGSADANLFSPGGAVDAKVNRAERDASKQPNGSFDDAWDVNTATELVIPVNTEVQLKVTSNDVIHSFWIPALNGKKDAVPGMESDWKLIAEKPGVFLGQCTEFCGLSHGNMRMLVRAVPLEEWRAWVENQRLAAPTPDPANTDAVAGQAYFKSAQCAQCHLIRGLTDDVVHDAEKGVKTQLVSGNAPELTHLMSRGMFGGAIFNLHVPDPDPACVARNQGKAAADQERCDDPANAANPGNPANPLNRTSLEAWLRNPPAEKPMCPAPVASHTCDAAEAAAHGELPEGADKRVRGMPNLGLTEAQIDQLVAYLQTLK